jgi:hypothetical protein
MSDPPVASCPDCGDAAERVVSGGAGFLFKGEGFYITDSRSEDYRKKAQADKGPAPDAAASEKSKNATSAKSADVGKGSGSGDASSSGSGGSSSSGTDG